jgi:tRNA (guanine-N7-)-methyltransferase
MDFTPCQIDMVRAYRRPDLARRADADDWTMPTGPIDLEIGCGVGLHAIRYAQANPQRHLIAIERTSEKFEKFWRRLQRHPDISNIKPVHEDAVSWIDRSLKNSVIDRIFLLYPNPNPRNVNRRWHAMPFFAELLRILKVDGTIEMATNIQNYADEADDLIQRCWGMSLIERRAIEPADFSLARTHFEKKYLLRGEKCHNLIFRKS